MQPIGEPIVSLRTVGVSPGPSGEGNTVRLTAYVLPLVLLAAAGCKQDHSDPSGKPAADATQTTQAPSGGADSMASHDPGAGQGAQGDLADAEQRPVMQMQVVLDRLGFSLGVIDGKQGLSLGNALSGYQAANDLPTSGKPDEATLAKLRQWSNIPATRVVTIPDDFAAGPFIPVPKDPAEQAKLQHLGYGNLDEKLAERFHTTVETLHMLNPGGAPAGSAPAAGPQPAPAPQASATPGAPPPPMFRAGQKIRVPNVGSDALDASKIDDQEWLTTLRDLGVGSNQPKVEKVVVSKSKGTLMAYDASGKLVAVYTATMGSSHDPLPLGEWTIKGVARNPPFHYNPDLFWDASAKDEKQKLPPGPNGPVGVVWIDLSKPHYGIHGTPEPQTIGRAESHGCVRLTNWDAARLAQMVKPGTVALFEK